MSYPDEIKVFVNEVVGHIKEGLNPDFILLAGSFGKSSWLFEHDQLVSDFEFVFVSQKKWSLSKKKKLLNFLNDTYDHEISLKGYLRKKIEKKIISNYSFSNPGYISLDFFDTFSNPVYLYSKNKKTLSISCENQELPAWEAWRLYVNRIGELLDSSVEDKSVDLNRYYWLKVFESTADVYLILNKQYEKNILTRYERFSTTLLEEDTELPSVCRASYSLIKQALKARKEHDVLLFEPTIDSDQKKALVYEWLCYIEKRVAKEEKFNQGTQPMHFHQEYLDSHTIQKKYLGFRYWIRISVSNLTRLLNTPKLLKSKLKIFNLSNSWRHLILLSLSAIFQEQFLKNQLTVSRQIMNSLLPGKYLNSLSDKIFVSNTLYYWKYLR